MIALLLLMLAQAPEPDRVKCGTTGGPIPLGMERVIVPLKCCPKGFFVSDPDHPADKNGNLICSRET
jgi:hypothetical protein